MVMNLPTWLTLFRLALVPVVIAALLMPLAGANVVAAAGFVIAMVTDWLDGYLARRWDVESDFGAFLDPVADKLLVCSVLVVLVSRDPRIVVALAATVIICRELTVSALREWMAELGQRGVVAVGAAGKYKTTIQMAAILIMIFALDLQNWLYDLGVGLLVLAAVLTIWSMVLYMRQAWPILAGQVDRNADR
ncbi:MAG: CDP-diacylglycerol--glycerol-3-phosphate 3-phosphatidyltransferase [Salinisphaeraceae bacterium]|nr:CDP-diacylglycerol--glycerol-3-phosphate 3-phosphatidyltransferase [Salinisphaeraceae bacterium]